MIKRAIDDLLVLKQADQISQLPTSWFGLEIFTRSETVQNVFDKGFDDCYKYKYFMHQSDRQQLAELLKMLIDAADMNQWLTEYPKAKEVWDKSLDYADVLWQYRAPSKLPIPFPDEVEVKLLDG